MNLLEAIIRLILYLALAMAIAGVVYLVASIASEMLTTTNNLIS